MLSFLFVLIPKTYKQFAYSGDRSAPNSLLLVVTNHDILLFHDVYFPHSLVTIIMCKNKQSMGFFCSNCSIHSLSVCFVNYILIAHDREHILGTLLKSVFIFHL